MGNSDQGKSCKPEKSTSPLPERGNIHVYPDWATMQAYYGPPPYFNSHAPHPYMWGPPQHMIPPFGAPYWCSPCHAIPASPTVSEAMAATSASMGTHGKSSGNKQQGLMSKPKEFHGLEMSVRNGNADNDEVGADQGISESTGTEGSSDGSNAAGAGGNNNKRMRETTPTNGKFSGTGVTPNMMTALDLRNLYCVNPKAGAATVPQLGPEMPNEAWLENERELKREKRKQSNRESARRSRLRKQAETEELAMRVQSLSAENMTLKSEINKLTKNSDKLKLENAALKEKLQNNKQEHLEEIALAKIDDKRLEPMNTANLVARVKNCGSMGKNDEGSEGYEKNRSRAQLHQLLDASRRTDAMAACNSFRQIKL